MVLKNKVYDVMKWIALIVLPAISALYFALANVWSLPAADKVVGTIAAIDTFIGAILGISTAGYKGDGTMILNPDDEGSMDIEMDEDQIQKLMGDQKTVVLKVEKK